MQLVSVFEELKRAFVDIHKGEVVRVSLEEISQILSCTIRNANLIMKKLHQRKWLVWTPGKGRGNVSTLEFQLSLEEIYLEIAKEVAGKGDLTKSLQLVEGKIVQPSLKEEYFKWLVSCFGYYSFQSEETELDILRIPSSRIGSLEPMLTTCGIEAHLVRQLFDTLVVYNEQSHSFEGKLANEWEVNDDYTEWTFYLKKGIYFHDGSELTSIDVEYTFLRFQEMEGRSPYTWIVEDMMVEIINRWSVKFVLVHPNKMFLHYIASHPCSIIPKKAYQNKSHKVSNFPVGSGPFKLVKNDENVLILGAHTPYFDGRPFLDQIELWKITRLNASNRVKRPDAFQLDYVSNRTGAADGDQWNVIEKLENGCKLLSFNLSLKGIQQNKLFRSAILHCIDKEALVGQQGKGFVPANELLPEGEGKNHPREPDHSRAQELLRASGYQGEALNLYSSSYHLSDAELIKNQCARIGIHLIVKEIPPLGIPYPPLDDAHLLLYELIHDADLVFSLLDTYMTKSSYMRRHLNDELLTRVIEQLQSVYNGPDALRHLNDIEKELQKELAFITLYRRVHHINFDPALQNVSIGPLGWADFKGLWYKKGLGR